LHKGQRVQGSTLPGRTKPPLETDTSCLTRPKPSAHMERRAKIGLIGKVRRLPSRVFSRAAEGKKGSGVERGKKQSRPRPARLKRPRAPRKSTHNSTKEQHLARKKVITPLLHLQKYRHNASASAGKGSRFPRTFPLNRERKERKKEKRLCREALAD